MQLLSDKLDKQIIFRILLRRHGISPGRGPERNTACSTARLGARGGKMRVLHGVWAARTQVAGVRDTGGRVGFHGIFYKRKGSAAKYF